MTYDSKARSILIVEDEALVALHLEDLLIELGHQTGEIVGRINDAIEIARNGRFDFAILDINVAGGTSFLAARCTT